MEASRSSHRVISLSWRPEWRRRASLFSNKATSQPRSEVSSGNTSSWLADNSIPGRVLHTLLGYTGKPTQLQLLVYLATLGTIFGLMKLAAPRRDRISGSQ